MTEEKTVEKKERTKKEPKVEVSTLTKIQMELKAPKSQWNDFSKFFYRNAEDIESGLKPLLEKYGCEMLIDDEPIMVGDWHYIKATVSLKTPEGKSYVAHGYAREELNKKGQDASQTSGSASSYARKYALGGMFLIDDTKDADSMDNRSQNQSQKPAPRKQTTPKGNFNLKEMNEEKLLDYAVKFDGEIVSLASVYKAATDNNNPKAEKASKFIHHLITNPQRKNDTAVIKQLTENKVYQKAKDLAYFLK